MTDTTEAPALAPIPAPTLEERLLNLESNLGARLDAIEERVLAAVPQPVSTDPWWKRLAATGLSDLVKVVWRVLTGLRTLIFFGIAGAASLADQFTNIDVGAYISTLFPFLADASRAQIITWMAVAGIVLRWLTKTPMFSGFFKDQG